MTSFVNLALCIERVKPITREERLMDRYVADVNVGICASEAAQPGA
jgi:hypothetical protein